VSDDFAADPVLAKITDVPNWTPASVLREFGRIDFVKIDAEGAEENILAGLKPLLGAHRPDLVLEFNRPVQGCAGIPRRSCRILRRGAWLAAHFDDIGVKGTMDLAARIR
jgi:Methyltransferase FkbM domain